ncbi:MAG TPA: diguanylate cyclase, partial [Rubrivivax sp.]|nr:diguanylate cyclase [Rubrivivax sp.]
MSSPLIAVSYDFWTVALSYVIACFASYVALDLSKRVRSPDRAMANGWWLCGSLAMGTGVWAMHFVGMQALRVPFQFGFDHVVTGLSWVAAVGVSALALYIASFKQLGLARLAAGALAMGSGICVMHYTGMMAMDMVPGIQWNWQLIGLSVVVAVGASAVALLLFFWLRTRAGGAAWHWQLAAALVMGGAIFATHYTGMAAAGFPEGSICRSADQLRSDGLGGLATIASLVLMTLTMLAAELDSRLQGRSTQLAASLQNANTQLQQLAFRDALTGLPNRLLFDEHVAGAVERSARSNQPLAVLFIDLDGFKPVNDSFGHARGDEVLREMAKRLQQLTRSSDTVARVGGDEFVLLLEEMDGPGAAATAQRIIDTCSAPVAGGGHELRLSCSIGIAIFPTDGPRDQLLAHADAAMYAAKRIGGSSYAFFEPKMNAGIREQIDLQRDLREALATGGQLQLYYQPK